jgi:hypothetical protein
VAGARRSARWGLALAVALLGCASAPAVQGRISALRESLDQADRNGARRCAPRELALGRAHAEFADRELAEGHMSRAEDHLLVSDANARAAMTLSPPDRCAPRAVVVATGPGDRDGDGIPRPRRPLPRRARELQRLPGRGRLPRRPGHRRRRPRRLARRVPHRPRRPRPVPRRGRLPRARQRRRRRADTSTTAATSPKTPTASRPRRLPRPRQRSGHRRRPPGPVPQRGRARGQPRLPAGVRAPADHPARGALPVEFDFDRATLRPAAAATLDEVVQFLGSRRTARCATRSAGTRRARAAAAQRAASPRRARPPCALPPRARHRGPRG